MRTHLQNRRYPSGAFLSELLLLTFSVAKSSASPGGHTTSFEQLFSTDPNNATITPVCDDAQLRNVAQQVAQLSISSENIFLLLDSYNLRLDYITRLLDERLPEIDQRPKPHWNDVRGGPGGGGEHISSTHTSTGGVLFPSLSTLAAASATNMATTGSQSSAAGVDLPVNNAQYSASGVNIPATNSAAFVGVAYLPVIGTQSSKSAADYSPNTNSPTS